jgi:hypothetical protein
MMRTRALRCFVLVAALIAACESSARPSAIDRARELGWEIPVVQLEAFEDGAITFAEVEAAAERFERCAVESSVGIDVSVDRDSGMSWVSDRLSVDERILVSSCETTHVLATHEVYMEQLRRADVGS